MGYDIVGRYRKDDDYEKVLIHISCQYDYEPIFREAFGREITELHGKVTKKKIPIIEKGITNFVSNKNNNRDSQMLRGNLANCKYEQLCDEFVQLNNLIKERKVQYLSIS